MKHIYKDGTKESELDNGVCSIASWDAIKPHLENLFKIKPNEVIAGIVVSEEGIKAKIETIKYTKND